MLRLIGKIYLISLRLDKYSEKEMREAQETILYHLSKATEFSISEKDMVNFCRVK